LKKYHRHVVKAIIKDKRGILLIYIPQKNVYELPGGGVEENETLEEALKREISEETGYKLISIKSKLSEKEEILCDRTNLIHFYDCSVSDIQDQTNLTDEEIKAGMEPVWYDLASAIKNIKNYIRINETITDCSREKRTLGILIEFCSKSNI
jgi:8-oxo-dGTP pyrophosphatase MutT (NUDIX family)